MSIPSITSIDTFRQRAQHSERWRTIIMLGVLGVLLAIVLIRRAVGGQLMASNRIFVTTLIVLLGVVTYEALVLGLLRRADRAQRLLPESFWRRNALIELAAPLIVLTLQQVFPAEHRIEALSAPSLLLIPIIITLSILRLRPAFTIGLSVIAAATHLTLTICAIVADHPGAHMVPMLLTYPALLMIGGVCAGLVAREARRHMNEAINETLESEAARLRIANMEHDLGMARDIQRGLIPMKPPTLAGFNVAGVSHPADLTGGDYYDWQTLPDGRVLVAMADVTGHGIGPAMVMAICRAYARAVGPILPDLTQTLNRLNTLICDDVRGLRFITLALALIDAKRSSVELLSAGHGPSLLYRAANRSVERFNGDGVPLGIVEDEVYGAPRRLDMACGDLLLLMTDGYFESRRNADNQQFGIERIEALLIRHAAQDDAATLLGRLDDEVRAFVAGAAQADDMTAVIIKRV